MINRKAHRLIQNPSPSRSPTLTSQPISKHIRPIISLSQLPPPKIRPVRQRKHLHTLRKIMNIRYSRIPTKQPRLAIMVILAQRSRRSQILTRRRVRPHRPGLAAGPYITLLSRRTAYIHSLPHTHIRHITTHP